MPLAHGAHTVDEKKRIRVGLDELRRKFGSGNVVQVGIDAPVVIQHQVPPNIRQCGAIGQAYQRPGKVPYQLISVPIVHGIVQQLIHGSVVVEIQAIFGELPALNVGFGAAGNATCFGGDVYCFWDFSIGGVGDELWLYDVFKDLGALRTFVACSWN